MPCHLAPDQCFERCRYRANAPAETVGQQARSRSCTPLGRILQIEQVRPRRVPRLQHFNRIGNTAENDSQLFVEIMRGSGGHSVSLIGFR